MHVRPLIKELNTELSEVIIAETTMGAPCYYQQKLHSLLGQDWTEPPGHQETGRAGRDNWKYV